MNESATTSDRDFREFDVSVTYRIRAQNNDNSLLLEALSPPNLNSARIVDVVTGETIGVIDAKDCKLIRDPLQWPEFQAIDCSVETEQLATFRYQGFDFRLSSVTIPENPCYQLLVKTLLGTETWRALPIKGETYWGTNWSQAKAISVALPEILRFAATAITVG